MHASEFYSIQIVQQRLRVSILRGHLNSLRLGKDRTPQLRSRMVRAGLDFPLPPTHRTTRIALRQACNELQHTCKENANVRQAELLEKINIAAMRGNKSKEQILRSIQRTENNLKTYKILKAMTQTKTQSVGIDRVEIPASWPAPDQLITSIAQLEDPKTCTEWTMITDPAQVEYYLLLRNRLHFGQAEGTPFTRPLCVLTSTGQLPRIVLI